MRKKSKSPDQDRYLIERGGIYYYRRRVPERLKGFDERFPQVRLSLETDDLALAREKRDLLEKADDKLWAALLAGIDAPGDARAAYQVAVRRAESLGFDYRQASDIAVQPVDEIVQRVLAIMGEQTPHAVEEAALGGVEAPRVRVSEAFDIYCNEIVADELVTKSEAQKAMWKKVKQRAVNNFIEVNGDLVMSEITRDHAKKFFKHWKDRVAPGDSKATHSASSGNRDVGNMRKLFAAYFEYENIELSNPFANLSFSTKGKRKRPPFPMDWIQAKILVPGAMATMNLEARCIVYAIFDTGGRPSEICNQIENTIVLDHEVPHLRIEPRDDPDDPREIKTVSSVRIVPLIGAALEVFKLFPKGFPHYKDRESSMSTALNKYFARNKLFPTSRHKIYSFRHTFEDRMKEAGIDRELRQILMGHQIDRPEYGEGGSLAWRRDQLKKIEVPFDPAILTTGRGLLPSWLPAP